MPLYSRRVPWAPGLLTTEPRGYAARLAEMGRTGAQIRDALKTQFPSLSPQQAGQLAAQAGRVRNVLDQFDRRLKATFDRQDLPRNPGLPEAYRFIVRVELRNPDTGDRYHRVVVLDYSSNPEQRQISEDAKALAQSLIKGPRRSPPIEEPEQVETTGMSIILAERRS